LSFRLISRKPLRIVCAAGFDEIWMYSDITV
jgi:hypothetical protein